jgi:hypothetical protein
MKKIYLGLGVVVIAGATLAGVFWKKSDNKLAGTSQGQNQTNNQTAESVNPSGSYSINELFNMKRPIKCTWKESATGDKDVTNIIYINGKKFYQDVTMGDVGHVYTISDGVYLYIWNDFSGAASKMKIAETETGINAKQESAGMDQKKDFVCENWSADNSVFNLPSGKTFKDVTEEMTEAVQDLQENSEEYKQQACDACKNAPSQELIDQCFESMQCSQ